MRMSVSSLLPVVGGASRRKGGLLIGGVYRCTEHRQSTDRAQPLHMRAGYLFTYYHARISDERKAQIERINDQARAKCWEALGAGSVGQLFRAACACVRLLAVVALVVVAIVLSMACLAGPCLVQPRLLLLHAQHCHTPHPIARSSVHAPSPNPYHALTQFLSQRCAHALHAGSSRSCTGPCWRP